MCRLFCEDPTTTQSDEFFGIFDGYVTSLYEAKQENDNIRRKKEEEEKIAKQHQEVTFLLLHFQVRCIKPLIIHHIDMG